MSATSQWEGHRSVKPERSTHWRFESFRGHRFGGEADTGWRRRSAKPPGFYGASGSSTLPSSAHLGPAPVIAAPAFWKRGECRFVALVSKTSPGSRSGGGSTPSSSSIYGSVLQRSMPVSKTARFGFDS